MLLTLGFPKPPDNITALQLFDKVHFLFVSLWYRSVTSVSE
jgi:hypothetical protein